MDTGGFFLNSEQLQINAGSGTGRNLFRISVGAVSLILLALQLILLNISNFSSIYLILLFGFISIFKPMYPLYFLALILPFFGNNPGGKYSLILIDQLAILLLLRWLIPLIWKKNAVILRSTYDIWIWLFFFISALSLFPIRNELYNAYLFSGGGAFFLKRVFTTYAVNYYWSFRLISDLFISILFFYYIINNAKNKLHLKNLGLCALSSFFLCVFLGILDFHNIIDLTFFRATNPDLQRFGYRRLMGLFWHSGWFAEYVALLAPFFLAPFFLSKKTNWKFRIPAAIMLFYAILFSYQRAGWIAFAFSMIVLTGLGWKNFYVQLLNRKILVFLLVLIFVLGAGFTFFITSDMTSGTPLAQRLNRLFFAADRTGIWDQALFLYSKKPCTGIGAGNYYFYHRSNFPKGHAWYHYDKVTSHSTYLHILVERGPFALLIFLCLLGAVFKRTAKAFAATDANSFNHILSGALLASIAAFSIYALAQYMFYIRIISIISWFLFALSDIVSRDCVKYKTPNLRKSRIVLVSFILILLILLLFNHTYRDQFYWNEYTYLDTNSQGAWVSPWQEFCIDTDKEVLDARFISFHPDVKENPLKVNMEVNGKVIASCFTRDNKPHDISAFIPVDAEFPIKVRILPERTIRAPDFSPSTRDRVTYYCMVDRKISGRELGMKGIGFSKWEYDENTKYRWTVGKYSVFEVKIISPLLRMKFLAGNPDLSENPLPVKIRIRNQSGDSVAKKELLFHKAGEWLGAAFNLSSYKGKKLRIEVETGRTFCPLDNNGNDSRNLGIYMSEPYWGPEPTPQ
jgi:O-antigen ligase